MHMKKFGKTKHEAIENYKSIVTKDLSSKVEKPVEFEVFDKLSYEDPFTDNFEDISCFADIDNLNFENYKESPDLLELSNKTGYFTLRFNGFRSNCRVTHQPDFSNIFIAISGNTPSMDSLVRYLVSFRNEFHFHEEVTEQIFKALKEKYKPNSLLVGNLFTRRGGIDICPIRRFNYPEQPIESIMDLTIPTIYQ